MISERLACQQKRCHLFHVASPIQTLTVGSGISPDQPSRLAGFHRRYGITPVPEVCLYDNILRSFVNSLFTITFTQVDLVKTA
jgi:hypothetical protein